MTDNCIAIIKSRQGFGLYQLYWPTSWTSWCARQISFRLLVAMKSLVTYSNQKVLYFNFSHGKCREGKPLVQKATQHHVGKPPSCPPSQRHEIMKSKIWNQDLFRIWPDKIAESPLVWNLLVPLNQTNLRRHRSQSVIKLIQQCKIRKWWPDLRVKAPGVKLILHSWFNQEMRTLEMTWSRVRMSGESPPCTHRTCPSINAATVNRSNTWSCPTILKFFNCHLDIFTIKQPLWSL